MTVFLAEILEQPEKTVRERLRQWYLDGSQKKGKKRAQIDVEQSFVPLLSWIPLSAEEQMYTPPVSFKFRIFSQTVKKSRKSIF